MRFSRVICASSVALVLLFAAVTEARTTRHHGRHHSRKQQEEEQQPAVSEVQQEEPKVVNLEPDESLEASVGSEEKPRPARQRKAPVLCNANAAASNLGEADKKETPNSRFVIIKPESAESIELPSSEEEAPVETPAAKPKPVRKPKGKVVEASSEESQSVSVEEEENEDDNTSADISAALESLEQPEAPKALTEAEIPNESSRAVESEEEEKPKVRRSKHHRKDIRKIGRPHRRRVVFESSEED